MQMTEEGAKPNIKRSKLKRPIVDCDIHHYTGGNLEYKREHHLDPNNIHYGILTGESQGVQGTINFDYAADLYSFPPYQPEEKEERA